MAIASSTIRSQHIWCGKSTATTTGRTSRTASDERRRTQQAVKAITRIGSRTWTVEEAESCKWNKDGNPEKTQQARKIRNIAEDQAKAWRNQGIQQKSKIRTAIDCTNLMVCHSRFIVGHPTVPFLAPMVLSSWDHLRFTCILWSWVRAPHIIWLKNL